MSNEGKAMVNRQKMAKKKLATVISLPGSKAARGIKNKSRLYKKSLTFYS
tara:strand:+ start:526 stop:675 length:150 start_codon:yes stop_codon:yes gene_type:complete